MDARGNWPNAEPKKAEYFIPAVNIQNVPLPFGASQSIGPVHDVKHHFLLRNIPSRLERVFSVIKKAVIIKKLDRAKRVSSALIFSKPQITGRRNVF